MERTQRLEITDADLATISQYKSNKMARNTLECIRKFIFSPGGKEFLDTKIEQMKAEGHPLMQPRPEDELLDQATASEV
ncbi:MAG: hypothetical protein IJZ89_03350 [Clostridia bacterium]|nr:hypothetical protein [Clostridia bacterium]